MTRHPVTVLVVAKAPVAGQVKTRLAADLGGRLDLAADLAAAALLDTLDACSAADPAWRRRIALAGDLADAARSDALLRALAGWEIVPQYGDGLDERLAHAHRALPGPVVQVGMDTPQITGSMLRDLAGSLTGHDAVLAPATDGGWWALAVRSGRHGSALQGVPMSSTTTYAATRQALTAAGLRVTAAPVLTDADHLADAVQIAHDAPWTRFAAALDAPVLAGGAR